jgi:hypothetical protein
MTVFFEPNTRNKVIPPRGQVCAPRPVSICTPPSIRRVGLRHIPLSEASVRSLPHKQVSSRSLAERVRRNGAALGRGLVRSCRSYEKHVQPAAIALLDCAAGTLFGGAHE